MSLEKSFPIYKKNHASGNIGWRVDMGVVGAKRVFKHFPTETDARKFQKRCLEVEARKKPADLRDLSDSMRHEVLAALAKLRNHNATITQAVDFYLKHSRPATANATIGEVMEEFRKSKRKAGMSEKYIHSSWTTFFMPFKNHFMDCMISELTTETCEEYICKSKTWNPTTKRSHIRHLSVLCNFAVKHGCMSCNPFAKVEKPRHPPGTSHHRVVTVGNVVKILQFALNNDYKPECAALVLLLFCGVRTEEVARTTWNDIKLDEDTPVVHLHENMTKAGKSRVNAIPPNALEWLTLLRAKGPVVSASYESRMRNLRRKAQAEFKQNSACISFASYHMARFEDAPKTAFLLGHDNPTLLYNTYKALVTKTEAERYWTITPDYDGRHQQISTPSADQIEAKRTAKLQKVLTAG